MGLSGRSSSLSPFTRRTQNDLPMSMERERVSAARSMLPMASLSSASCAASVTRTSAARTLWALPLSVLAADLRRLGQSRCQCVPPQCRHLRKSFVQAPEVAFGFASR
eukprot:2824463-Pleurochrysis_carterae.AAC.1